MVARAEGGALRKRAAHAAPTPTWVCTISLSFMAFQSKATQARVTTTPGPPLGGLGNLVSQERNVPVIIVTRRDPRVPLRALGLHAAIAHQEVVDLGMPRFAPR